MKSTQKKVSGDPIPTRWHGFIFFLKESGLRGKRFVRNVFTPLPRSKPRIDFQNGVLLGQSVSLLRFSDENTAVALVDGKIQNIRMARKRLDGIVIHKGETFSFWRHVGPLTRTKGYALGRELREGCIIPQIGGGICQLSNAICDAALKAGLEFVERHRHTAVIKGSLAELGRDATVGWNYIDLRLRGTQDWQLQVKMDDKRLAVSVWGEKKSDTADETETPCAPAALGDCTWCGRTDCYLHAPNMLSHTHKTYLSIEEEWPEFVTWRKKFMKEEDRLISPSTTRNLFSKLARRRYIRLGNKEYKRTEKLCQKNGRYIFNWRKYPIPIAHNARFCLLAKGIAKQLKVSDTYLIVPQPLLVWLYREGALAGRQYDVLMTALPIPEIEKRLDAAMERYGFKVENGYYEATNPANPCGEGGVTLGDFRAPAELVNAEAEALAGASALISPHKKIVEWAGDRGIALKWLLPEPVASVSSSSDDRSFKILLAGVSLARKGIFDVRNALRNVDFDYELLLLPSALESRDFWKGMNVRTVQSMEEGVALCDAVVLPAVVEHNPRGLLLALASQKPTIASGVCGLPEELDWKQADNAEELAQQLKEAYRMAHISATA
ncbi:MAG: VanW family protein [Oscillospiraceae bacterium]|nr:VanW family protein [Oscillospiraceae bacterium]